MLIISQLRTGRKHTIELDLTKIRDEIDIVDKEIVEYFQKRMKLCEQVAQYKIENGKKVFDKEREEQKIEKVVSMAEGDFNRKSVGELFSQIMSMSRKLQYQILTENGKGEKLALKKVDTLDMSDVKVVYQGVPGAYSQQAMIKYFGKDVENFNVKTFRDAFEAVKDGRADYAVLPIENSTAGIVEDVNDLLYEYDNYIVAETDVLVRHALIGTQDATIEDIKTVYSHPQGLMQCEEYLDEHEEWQRIAKENTAGSARKVMKDNDKSHAAIASVIAAEIYGLKVLEDNINHNDKNTTRFIILGNKRVFKADASKVLITFEVSHESGSLYHLLSHFIFNGVNMCMIQSRPIREKNWEYRFFVEVEGNLSDEGMQNALNGIRHEASSFKVIGSY